MLEANGVVKNINRIEKEHNKLKEVGHLNIDIDEFLRSIDEIRKSFNEVIDYLIKDWEDSCENKYEALLMLRYKSKYFKGLDTLFLVELRFGEEVFIKIDGESKEDEFNRKFNWYRENEIEFEKVVNVFKTSR